LGNGTLEPSSEIESVVGVSLVRRLFVSQVIHNCVILADGRLQCWGGNSFGALGDGTTLDRSIAVTVPGLDGVVDVALGDAHSCALDDVGTVLCWGDNTSGQLGTGSPMEMSLSPVRVAALSDVRDIAAGWNHTCAVLNDGTLRCWGDNTNGQLGNDSVSSSTVPVRVVGP
jgi:alpha-tubulin suppressor-like RCC1 family protein